ncbi:SCY1-like protein 2 [Eumeta japonica]|uniref:SCY1-like protein 2 n=1 Tax=Eumeta variegata TaxID=151549 RepID=A0A4C1T3E0_EUMVA|nr:SCY1-like protein 2 [Eumeta japonica]
MDVINKLYSSVHTTVSQPSGVLPGNNVTREYEVLEQTCTAGTGLLWKVYNGFKKSTKQEVSVFVFEKKCLDRWTKEDREAILESMRRGVQQLTKIRHPHVLTVQHPLEESRDSLAFATEPVLLLWPMWWAIRPKDASDILAAELEKSSVKNSLNDDMFLVSPSHSPRIIDQVPIHRLPTAYN